MKRYWSLIALCMALPHLLLADTNVPGGTISVNTIWNLSGSPYIVQGSVTIASGVTLTVDSAVVVKFAGNYSLTLNGHLIADGTPTNRITFTTNNATPAPGQWGKLIFNSGSNSLLDNCDIRYGGSSSSNLVEINGGYVQISASNITNSQQYGIGFQGGSALITNIAITSCACPLYQNSWNGTILYGAGNNFTGNARNVVQLNTPLDVAADDSLPNPGVPYYVVSNLRVPAGRSLTITPGCILKFPQNGYLEVSGTLIAVGGGAVSDNIYCTDYRDDVWGGDSNGDGIATSPAVNWWRGINFTSTATASCRMDYCRVRYTGYSNSSYGGCVNISGSSPRIKRCDFSTSYYGVRVQGVTSAEIDSNLFGIATMVPVALGLESFPSFENNDYSSSDNGFDAIGILGGTLSADAVLPQRSLTSIPNVTYVVLNSITVPSGRTLQIQPGVVIKWYRDSGTSSRLELDIAGTLLADGSPTQNIVFTSVRDDNFGNPNDTNNDGSTTSPAAADWRRVRFDSTSVDAACFMNYCRLFYGGYSSSSTTERACLQASFASPTVTHCDFANTQRAITLFGNSNPNLQNNTYTNTTYEPVELSIAANPTFGNETITNVGYRALGILAESLPGNGVLEVKDFAGYNNITYILSGTLTIPSGASVTIEPGVVVKGTASSTTIDVQGILVANGTGSLPIVLTSFKDDVFGNPQDTNGDGSTTTPAPGDWNNITFNATSNDSACILDSCFVKWADEGVNCESSGALISNCLISNNRYGVRVAGNGNPRVWDTAINNAGYTPIIMSMASDPDFQNLTFNSNALTGLGILEGTFSGVGRLKRRDVAGISGIAYVCQSDVTIAAGGDLTIDPGVVIKLYLNNSPLYRSTWSVDGIIRARGNSGADSLIVWTSLRDDSRGGDTNNDGNSTVPAIGDWRYIRVNDSAVDSACALQYCEFLYGNYYGLFGQGIQPYGAVSCENASPVIEHCMFGFQYHGLGIFGNSSPVVMNCKPSDQMAQVALLD